MIIDFKIFLRDVIILLFYAIVIFYFSPRVVLTATGVILIFRSTYYFLTNYVNERSFKKICNSLPNDLKDTNDKINIIKKHFLNIKVSKGIFAGIIAIALGLFNIPLFKHELEQFLLGSYFSLPALIISVALINNFNIKNDLSIIKRKLNGSNVAWLETIIILLCTIVIISLIRFY